MQMKYADEIKENIRKSKGIGTVLSLDFTVLNGFCFNCNVVKSNGELLSNLQVDRGIVNDQELKQFVNLVKEKKSRSNRRIYCRSAKNRRRAFFI